MPERRASPYSVGRKLNRPFCDIEFTIVRLVYAIVNEVLCAAADSLDLAQSACVVAVGSGCIAVVANLLSAIIVRVGLGAFTKVKRFSQML